MDTTTRILRWSSCLWISLLHILCHSRRIKRSTRKTRMKRQLSRLPQLIKHEMASSACSASRSSRYSYMWEEASSNSQSSIEVKGHKLAGFVRI
ncbi:BgTH12-03051 [Blumeria graminis f. sp. triticale]|uniref:BgTH12-03051 n=1 Tax=Blumeria graminis f. sp. triticale TaxID=1689686 RepID=A0A9W4D3F2_BLUGR|nr:BgTH12-03051 [Blumeria graminis f. sp. triticale]